jgi:hypothetical protein
MRDFKGMKRQRGRNRGGGGSGGGKPQHNANRAFESNGPENVKVRGAAQSIFERYQQLARDASSAGDRVLAENYLQHAEHYFRTIRAMQPQRPVSEILGRDQVSSGFDIDFEAEPEEGGDNNEQTSDEGGEGEGQRDDRQRDDRNQQGQQRDRYENRDRPRDDRRDDRPRDGQQRDRYENRDRQRDDRPRDGQQRDDRPREDRPRDDRPREDRPQGEGRRDRWRERDNRDREPREQAQAAEPAPVEAPVNSPMLRSEDGEVSHAPAFLGRAAEPRAEGEAAAAPKPRRPRAPRKPAAEEV